MSRIVTEGREGGTDGGTEGGRDGGLTSGSAGAHDDRDLRDAGGGHVGLIVEDAPEVI